MTEPIELPSNVQAFFDIAAERAGRRLAELWNIQVWTDIQDAKMRSPIEQLFFIAVCSLCSANDINFNAAILYEGHEPGGLVLLPQAKIGKYRVDFQMHYHTAFGSAELIVELDGHEFHDKDKNQRSYEKARDRYLLSQGHRVVHYTGSDVVADANKVAWECLSLLDALYGSAEYDPKDPLGVA